MEYPKAHSSPRLKISLLGGFSVYVDGQILPDSAIKGRKARSLLKLVAHQRQYQIVREHVLDILWPDLAPEAGNAQLYKALHHIRKALAKHHKGAEDWVVITDDIIRLSPPGGLVTDMELFEKAARAGLKDKNIAELENAYSIYGGEFLPMDRYVEWASFPREHYRQLYLDVLSALAAAYEKQGELSEAAEMMRLALDKDPTLETAHRGLMGIFAKKGQATRAFHQYEICREILRDELGLSPSAETKKTLEDVQEGKLRAKEEAPAHRASFSGPTTPIIGCAEECVTINQLLENLDKRHGAGLVISGEAGMGKTRLVQELIQRARQKELPFFMGRAGTSMGSRVYGPFIELFIDILEKQPEMENLLPLEIGGLVPGFSGKGFPLPHADKLAAKGFLFAQIQRFFSQLTSAGPAVVILEDLHAADQESKELFSFLIQHRGQLPILFVATLRKEEGDPFPSFVLDLQEHIMEILELSPFSYEEHVNLLHLHAENAIIGADTADHIYQLAEGNPFYALELLRHYRENGKTAPPKQRQGRGGIPSSPVSENIPGSIAQMVEQKLEKLSPSAHHLLYIAAVIGRQVPYELLASIWNSGKMNAENGFYEFLASMWKSGKTKAENGFFNALEELIRARLLEEHGLDYCFRHALVQETIYSFISEARRQTLHKQIADQLLELSADTDEARLEAPAEQIAWHYLGARDMLKAANFLIQAGKQAENVYAHENALQRYREACDVLESVKSDQARNLKCEILEHLGDVYRACGQIEKSYDAYEEAISLAEDISSNHPELMELHRKMAVSAIFRTEIERSEKHLEKAFALVGNSLRDQSRLFITKALQLWHLNRLEEAYELAQKALSQAKKTEANGEASQACEMLAMICLPLGRWEEGLRYEMERKIHGWSPEIVVATDAHLCLWEYHVSGDQPILKAQSFIKQVYDQASQVGDLRCVAVCHYALGTMHLWRGNCRHAVEELSLSLELHERVGSPAGMAYSLARKAVLHTLMGARELAWQAVQNGLVYAMQTAVGDHCLQRLYGVGIWNRLEAGDLELAAELVGKSEKLLVRSGACAACALELYPWLSYYFLQTRQIEKARACGQAVSELAEKTGNPIGKAIACMIKSSLCITETDRKQAEEYCRDSYQILGKEVPETAYSPTAHFLKRMLEQQEELLQF